MKKEAMVNHDQGNSRFIVVYETLKKKIMEGELPSNTPLVEEKIGQGISDEQDAHQGSDQASGPGWFGRIFFREGELWLKKLR